MMLLPVMLLAEEDPWAQVRKLESGQELRIIKKGTQLPVTAQFGDLTDQNLIVIMKDTEKAIPLDDIDRIDARPPHKGSRVRTQTKVESPAPGTGGTPQNRSSRSAQTTTSGLSFEAKPGFDTVYRRTR